MHLFVEITERSTIQCTVINLLPIFSLNRQRTPPQHIINHLQLMSYTWILIPLLITFLMTSQISSLIRNDGKEGYQQQELFYHQAESMCCYFCSYSSEDIWLWSLNTSICRPDNLQWTKNPSESSNPSAPQAVLYCSSFLMFYALSHAPILQQHYTTLVWFPSSSITLHTLCCTKLLSTWVGR